MRSVILLLIMAPVLPFVMFLDWLFGDPWLDSVKFIWAAGQKERNEN